MVEDHFTGLMERRIKEVREIKAKALLGGGADKIQKLRERGKLTCRERIDRVLDPGSFVELGGLVGHLKGEYADGLVCGYGTVNGRTICVYSQDPTILGGSIGGAHGNKMWRTIERAMVMRVPLVGIHDSPGARNPRLSGESSSEEGGGGGGGGDKSGGSVFFPNTQASGVVPQISAMVGSCSGIAVYSPALTDFILMVDGTSHMFITGPRIVKSVMNEDVSMEDLGGAKVHARLSGVCDFRTKSEEECFSQIRKLLGFLPSSCEEKPPVVKTGDDPDRLDDTLGDIVPANPNKSYDVRKLIRRLVDVDDFLEVKAEYAPEIVVGFGRMDGKTVGFVANQSMARAGSLTCDSSDKQARFIRFCDCFNIPILLLVDTPAYQPGTQQEHAGIIHHGAKVLYALCEAVVPKIGLVIRKAYGGGQLGMGTIPGMNSDMIYNWPIVESGIMGAEQSVDLFFAEQIKAAPDPAKAREEFIRRYRDQAGNPLKRVSGSASIEDILEPRETRRALIRSFRLMETKKVERYPKRHGNIPL